MKADIEHYAANPRVISEGQGANVILQFQEVVQKPRGPERSGKSIQVTLSPVAAGQLLGLLQEVAAQLGIASAPVVTTFVPPDRERH